MKITKSMIYRPTAESRELTLCTENNGQAYPMICAVIANLARKMKKGVFDKEQATAAFYHVTTAEAKRYYKDFGYMFTVTERWTAAADVLEGYMEQIEEQAQA